MPGWHAGERDVHHKLGLDARGEVRPAAVLSSMPLQHQHFFSNLPYFIVGTCDAQGRPWASMLCGPRGFNRAISPNHLAFVTKPAAGDPVLDNILRGDGLIAGLGIEFETRRRNKVFGRIQPGMSKYVDGELQAIITTEQSLGNCPKYINVRHLSYHESADLSSQDVIRGSSELDDAQLEHVRKADTLFIASRHRSTAGEPSDMDANHRGGSPGFVRVATTDGVSKLYLPDFSGNNFFQTLGNLQLDHGCGVVLPDFVTGDMLYITGEAENVFGRAASDLIPGIDRLTVIEVKHWTFAPGSLQVRQSDAGAKYSPYNPPVFTLATETGGGSKRARRTAQGTATLIDRCTVSPGVARFTWRLSEPVPAWQPGQHAIFDFRAELHNGWEHMNDHRPQALNDTFVRSWTISNTAPSNGTADASTDVVETTIRKAGQVSDFLHDLQRIDLTVPFIGIDGHFGESLATTSKSLLIAGGIGITPFYSLVQSLPDDHDCIVLFVHRPGDADLAASLRVGPNTDLRCFDSAVRRISKSDFDGSLDLARRSVLFCGPDKLLAQVRAWLPDAEIEVESFTY